ncbi:MULTISPECIES: DUF1684 domain-containing protein [unclassified Rhodanobacter]|uniref:DUF1684 domain-containing protein n=1 Tax=unclassified Rhodanobacter TaxID=2621553 RepID=UPI001BDFB7C9|nr:DUF1684 domain-containing protein [Rhodanobacter sp. LX-99]MBT2148765.1 DUF1684 domain-containing protein [Rhodanobacter sp. LX-100]
MARITEWCAVAALMWLVPFSAPAAVPENYAAAVTRARAERVEQLKQADGYLALTASGWLQPGANSVGSAAGNRFEIPDAPAHLGTLQLAADGQVSLHLAETRGITIDGRPAPAVNVLRTQGPDGKQQPTRVGFGSSYLYVIENGTQRGLRAKNNDAPLRTHFPGFDYFPIDPSWRIEADWVPFPTPHMLKIAYVTGTVSDTPIAGKAVFRRDGRTYELLPVNEDGRLFFVFSDRTAGRLTYGGARFLYAAAPKDGKVLLDFNLAENPPCAITPHVVCPLAPPENRLKLPVTAGEMKFLGGGH